MIYMPKTLTEAVRYYADAQVCIDTVAALRWPNGKPVCPKCGVEENDRKHYWLAAQKRWKCSLCRKQFSVKVDSVFEDSALGLDIWLFALWMLVNCKNGVSSHEIAREMGVAQKNAWLLLHRLRYALQPRDGGNLGTTGGVIEVDEWFILNVFVSLRRATVAMWIFFLLTWCPCIAISWPAMCLNPIDSPARQLLFATVVMLTLASLCPAIRSVAVDL